MALKWRKTLGRRAGTFVSGLAQQVRDHADRLPTRAVAGHAYAFLGAVFLLVGIFTVEKTATRHREARDLRLTTPVALQELRQPFPIAPDAVVPARRAEPKAPPAAKETTKALPTLIEEDGDEAAPTAGIDPWTFFHAAWAEEQPGRLVKLSKSGLFSGPVDLPTDVRSLVDDPSKRVEPEFRVPPYLRERVLFWMQVHAQYGNHMRLVHDRDDPSVVYGYLDFRALHRSAESPAQADSLAYRAERKILKELRARLSEAAGITPPGSTKQSAEERTAARAFLSRVGALGTSDASARIANIRTQTGQRDEFLAALKRSKELLPHIESVFRQQGLPVALGRIPFVESSFNTRAKSRVGAVGMWQFMPATARQMISARSEHWADPQRQTIAATKVLKMFRGMLPDWSTSVTAYNSGVGRLQRLVRRHRAKNLEPLLSDRGGSNGDGDGLGFAGENFYAQFLSANLIEAYKGELFQRWAETPDFFVVFKDGVPFSKTATDR